MGRTVQACAILLLLCLTGTAFAEGDWELVTKDRREYVTLKSFCKFYKFDYPGKPGEKSLHLKNDRYDLVLKFEDRETWINGIKYWMSFGTSDNESDWLISRVDLTKLFEPVFRPRMVAGRKPVKGVVLDPGHGGQDNGALSKKGKMEKAYALDSATRVEALLKAADIPVVMTRRTDVFVELNERAARAARYEGYIFVSLHYNFAGPDARGIECYAMTPAGAGSTQAGGGVARSDFQKLPGNTLDSLNTILASEIHKQLIKLYPADTEVDRGFKRARFVVLKRNELPSVLVEGGFLTNRMESNLLDTPEYRQKLAVAVVKGIQSYMKLMSDGTAEQAPVPRPTPVPVIRPTATPTPVPEQDEERAPTPRPVRDVEKLSPTPMPPGDEPPVIIYPVSPRSPEVSPREEEPDEPPSGPPAQSEKHEGMVP